MAVEHAIMKVGIRHIDTASIYKNESDIALALAKVAVPREELFITSKISPYEMGTAKSQSAIAGILSRLQTPYLDLLLIHWPGPAKTKPDAPDNRIARQETWRVMESAYREGRCRSIGVSNFTIAHLQDMFTWCDIRPMANQVEVKKKKKKKTL